MAVTIQQIADRAGVSRGTVDRALNGRGRINPDVANRILRIADEMGYVPKRRRAAVRRRYRIGVITQLSRSPFMSEINRGITEAQKELKNQKVEVLVEAGLSVDTDEQLRAIDHLLAEDIDGLAIMPVDDEKIREKLNRISEERQIPIVTFNTDISGTRRRTFVGMDNEKSGRAAAGLMGVLTRGSGKILVITGFFGNRVNSMRVDGFVNEIKKSYPEMEIAAVQSCFDDADEVERIVVSAMLGAQVINGILIVSAGQSGLDRAFAQLQMDRRPYVVTYDLTPWSRKALAEDKIDFLIDQDGYFQGYRSIWLLANLLINDIEPGKEFEYTDISIRTKYNI
ncbi:MAG: LacI family DNA-binding transcriptional regulator [Lachnospiraceae bacterium]|nr:LacI family DNA-binding transcriptional regulator [Lachnospiraceae bacterium]MCI1328920.1 LacI family DNA-binding transcriptional regulator [Lachnospiraceae bacterium]